MRISNILHINTFAKDRISAFFSVTFSMMQFASKN